MGNEDKKQRLALGYVKCKELMKDNNADFESLAKIEDIMLASIRTLDFIWDSNADKTTDYILESVLTNMSLIASRSIRKPQSEVYVYMIT